jgi:hypothetical protein
MKTCVDGRHGFNVRERSDGSRICFRCRKEWPGPGEPSALPSHETAGTSIVGSLPMMEQQERSTCLLDPLATNEDPDDDS